MIRSVFVLAAALVSVSAYAMPTVGDYAAYDVVLPNPNKTVISFQQELVAFDATRNEFILRRTQKFPGQAEKVETVPVSTADLLDDATVDSILAYCAGAGGTLQTITVPAGTFNTCPIPQNRDGSKVVYVAKVPFGFARMTDGGFDILLRSFH